MGLESLFGGVAIGKDASGNFRYSVRGLAVRGGADGQWYAPSKEGVVDVSGLVLDSGDEYIFRLPISKPKENDILILSDTPFSALVVKDVDKDSIRGIDPATCTMVDYRPAEAVIGDRWFVKAYSPLADVAGSGDEAALMAMALLSKDGGGSNNSLMTAVLLAGAKGGGSADELLPLLLASGSSDVTPLLLLQLMKGRGGARKAGGGGRKRPRAKKRARRKAAVRAPSTT